MTTKSFFAGYLVGVITIVGCASTTVFPFKYYAPHMPDAAYDEGSLYGKAGKDGWPDIPLDDCKPDPIPSPAPSGSPQPSPVLLKCIVLKVDDFYQLKAGYLKLQNDLAACESGPKPTSRADE